MKKILKSRVTLTVCLALLVLPIACSKKQEKPKPAEPRRVEVEKPDFLEHTVTYSGETLGVIARWYTGDAQNWKTIAEANPAIDPRRMSLGDTILIPMRIVARMEVLPSSAVPKVSAPRKVITEKPAEMPQAEVVQENTTAVEDEDEEVSALLEELQSDSPPEEVATSPAEEEEAAAETVSTEGMSEREKLLNELLAE